MIEPRLELSLESVLPESLPVGRGTAIFCFGTCRHGGKRVDALTLRAGSDRARASAVAMPRLDADEYLSGWWGTLPVAGRERPETIVIEADASLAGGGSATVELGWIEVVEPRSHTDSVAGPVPGSEPIAICMATHEPDLELLRAQLDSIRAQSDPHWSCLISDDCSSAERFAEIEQLVAGDRRFTLSRSERRLGFYRNFERCLGMAPAETPLVALCDQDDRWHPDKLAALRAAIGEAGVVYSDQRLVDERGSVLAGTYWSGRRNNHTDLISLLIANTVTGAAALYRREIVELALPFPDAGAEQYHDHWLALVGLATGQVRYLDRALYDYVQHGGAVLGHGAANRGSRVGRLDRGLNRAALREALVEWRFAYFDGCARLELLAEALLVRCGSRLGRRRRRALRRFVHRLRSPLGIPWFALRSVRGLGGRNETLGAEWLLVKGLVWRYYMALRARQAGARGRLSHDAAPPPTGPGGVAGVHPRVARGDSAREER